MRLRHTAKATRRGRQAACTASVARRDPRRTAHRCANHDCMAVAGPAARFSTLFETRPTVLRKPRGEPMRASPEFFSLLRLLHLAASGAGARRRRPLTVPGACSVCRIDLDVEVLLFELRERAVLMNLRRDAPPEHRLSVRHRPCADRWPCLRRWSSGPSLPGRPTRSPCRGVFRNRRRPAISSCNAASSRPDVRSA